MANLTFTVNGVTAKTNTFQGGDTFGSSVVTVKGGCDANSPWNEIGNNGTGYIYINGSQKLSFSVSDGSGNGTTTMSSGSYAQLNLNSVYFNSGFRAAGCYIQLSIPETSATTTIVLGQTRTCSLGVNSIYYYSFTPDKKGIYSFTPSSGIIGWISTSKSDQSSSGSTSTISKELNAGTTYYIGVKRVNQNTYSSTVSSSVTLNYTVPSTYINYVYNGKNTRKEKEGESYSLDTISSLGYSLNGWTFVGWSDEPENYNIIYTNGDTFTISSDITEYYLYPIWRKSFVITYKYGYPTPTIETDNAFIYSYERFTDNYDPLATSTYSQTSVFYNTKRITETFTYDERTFSPGVWYINNTTNYISMGMGTNISSNINFNGAYSSPNLSLFYEGNNEKVHGDTPDITNINQIYNSYNQSFQSWEVVASECGFTLSGKKFKEWNTQADGKGISYKVGEHIPVSVNTTVYAIWIDADTPFIFINGKEIKPYIYRNNKYYEIKIL